MRRVIYKVFAAWSFDKEEQWLNEMAAKGLCMVSVGFCRYEFEDCTPGAYTFRIQFLEHCARHWESQKYIEFLESTGVKHVGSWMRWIYLRKEAGQGPFELYSDNTSRLKHLSQIISLIITLGAANLVIGAGNVFLAVIHDSGFNYLGFLNIALGLWCAIGSVRLLKKRRRIKKEIQLFE